MLNYHVGRLVLSLLCVGAFVAADIWWCSFCRLKHNCSVHVVCIDCSNVGYVETGIVKYT